MQVLKSSFFRKFSPYFLKIPIFYAARCRCRMRTPMPLRGACGQLVQAKHRSVSNTIYAVHNKRGQRRERM